MCAFVSVLVAAAFSILFFDVHILRNPPQQSSQLIRTNAVRLECCLHFLRQFRLLFCESRGMLAVIEKKRIFLFYDLSKSKQTFVDVTPADENVVFFVGQNPRLNSRRKFLVLLDSRFAHLLRGWQTCIKRILSGRSSFMIDFRDEQILEIELIRANSCLLMTNDSFSQEGWGITSVVDSSTTSLLRCSL